jgi:hypothetical protein
VSSVKCRPTHKGRKRNEKQRDKNGKQRDNITTCQEDTTCRVACGQKEARVEDRRRRVSTELGETLETRAMKSTAAVDSSAFSGSMYSSMLSRTHCTIDPCV